MAELQEEIEEADAFNDPERAAGAREELGFLARELAGAVGLGGRDRKTGSDAERARVNVTRAIRTALKRVADHDPVARPQPRQRDPHRHVLRLRAGARRRARLGPDRSGLTHDRARSTRLVLRSRQRPEEPVLGVQSAP